MSAKNDEIVVAVRQRPLSDKELRDRCVPSFNLDEKSGSIFSPINSTSFKYNHVFDEKTDNATLYKSIAEPLLLKAFRGYNATILAYGQTGSGKTFTMGLEDFNTDLDGNAGIIPRLLKDLFLQDNYADEEIKRKSEILQENGNPENVVEPENIQIQVQCSYLELYNDQIYDLLSVSHSVSQNLLNANKPGTPVRARSPSCGSKTNPETAPSTLVINTPKMSSRAHSHDDFHLESLPIRQKGNDIYVQGLTKRVIQSDTDAIELMKIGNKNRSTGATEMNKTSSRSHACFTLY